MASLCSNVSAPSCLAFSDIRISDHVETLWTAALTEDLPQSRLWSFCSVILSSPRIRGHHLSCFTQRRCSASFPVCKKIWHAFLLLTVPQFTSKTSKKLCGILRRSVDLNGMTPGQWRNAGWDSQCPAVIYLRCVCACVEGKCHQRLRCSHNVMRRADWETKGMLVSDCNPPVWHYFANRTASSVFSLYINTASLKCKPKQLAKHRCIILKAWA